MIDSVSPVREELTLPQVAALLAVAQDHAFGQPPSSQLRATVLAQRLTDAVGVPSAERVTTWWTSTLRFLGCTGHAWETAVLFGDEIDLRAESLRADNANAAEVVRMMVARAGPGRSGVKRVPAVLSLLGAGRKAPELNFRTACEVADALAARLHIAPEVREALGANFERWNGRGFPAGLEGEAIPRPLRVAQLAQELEALSRWEGLDGALATIARRRGKGYDPALVDHVMDAGRDWVEALEDVDPWDAALDLAPATTPLDESARSEVLLVLADFADLKSPHRGGHSRRVAELAGEAAGTRAAAAALVHDLGCVAVPNTVWDKPGPLTRDERDRLESHSLVTEQLLRRVPFTAALAETAGAAHERMDGTGYHRRVAGGHLDDDARVLAAADCYEALTADRPQRSARSPEVAAVELRAMSRAGRLDGEAVERVLAAAGHRRAIRATLPAGLSPREAEVLRLLALGLTNRQVGDELGISPKTAGHHVQHIYTKVGVSTRGAVALWAIEHGILTTDA